MGKVRIREPLTDVQRGQFFRAVQAACMELGIQGREAREDYRKQILREELGVEHLSDVDRKGGFEKLMVRCFQDANDYENMVRFSGGQVERFRYAILKRTRELLALKGASEATTPEAYITGVLFQGRMIYRPFETQETFAKKLETPGTWTDFPIPTLHLLVKIINTDYQRLKAQKAKEAEQ